MGITGNMYNWISNFLDNRVIQVKIGASLSDVKAIENGTPQGSVISPILFLIMINDIAPPDVKTSLYADDTAVWEGHKNTKFLVSKMQNAVKYIENWSRNWGLKVSTEKTKLVLFTKKKKLKIDIKYKGESLVVEKQAKFLGLIFDEKLTWNKHIEYLLTKCRKRINILKVLAGTSWGANKESVLLLYKTIILSCLDYGSEAYDTATNSKLKKLEVIQNQCLRIATGAIKCTPISALEVDCGILPLHLRRKLLQSKAAIKYLNFENCPTRFCFTNTWYNEYGNFKGNFNTIFNKIRNLIKDIPKSTEYNVIESIPYWENEINIDLSLSSTINKSNVGANTLMICQEFIESWNNFLQIYTDGSVRDNHTASAFYIPDIKVIKSYRLSDNTSIFTAELVAILMALQWIEHGNMVQVVILSDSKSCVQSIDENNSDIVTVLNIRNTIFGLRNRGIAVWLAWVPSHVGIRGNELVDKAAKLALKNTVVDLQLPNDISSLYNIMKTKIMEMWQNLWDNATKGRMYYSVTPVVSTKPLFSCNNRQKEVVLNRLRYGFTRLNHTMHLIKLHPDGLCDTCWTPETVSHYLLDCIQYNNLQDAMIQECISRKLPINIKTVLTDKRLIDIIWKYVLQTKRDI